MISAGLVTFVIVTGGISAVFGVALAPKRVERTKKIITKIFEE